MSEHISPREIEELIEDYEEAEAIVGYYDSYDFEPHLITGTRYKFTFSDSRKPN